MDSGNTGSYGNQVPEPTQYPYAERTHDEKVDEEEILSKQALQIARGVAFPMVLKAAMELNLFEIISDTELYLSSHEVAGQIPGLINPNAPDMLDRMMRLLVSFSILKCRIVDKLEDDIEGQQQLRKERVYGLAPLATYFITKDLGGSSLGPLFLLHHDKLVLESWFNLKDAVVKGGIPFIKAHGMAPFEYMGKDDRYNNVFNQAMSNHTTFLTNRLLKTYKGFEGIKILVDVGGGTGKTLNIITDAYPDMKGINFDLPHVLTHDVPSYSRVEHVSGNMFENVPSGDAIFMKWILHDWCDDDCLKLLKNCWRALPPTSGKVIVVESILPLEPRDEVESQITFEQDMAMITHNVSGRERTKEEFESLATRSGFLGFTVICSALSVWVFSWFFLVVFGSLCFDSKKGGNNPVVPFKFRVHNMMKRGWAAAHQKKKEEDRK